MIGKEQAKRCALVMKTEISSQHGTDLKAIKDTFCDPEYVNVFFNSEKLTPEQMNLLYNVSDVNVLMSSNEGWGLSLTEAMMTGTMIIPNVTGGMQDQARFTEENGEWFTPSADIPSNHRGTYKEHGEWAVPVFPSNMSMMGSPLTPYIFDDRCKPEDVADAMKQIYDLGPEARDEKGMKGHEWVLSDESNMSSPRMCKRVIESIEKGFENFTPRPVYEIEKIGTRPSKRIKHKLIGY
jgi:glycosyltransferase involved in cell wall biosynthesis